MSRFIPTGWSATDVEQELLDRPTRAYVPFEALEVIDRPDWRQLTCRLFPSGGFNEVSRAKLADEAHGGSTRPRALARSSARHQSRSRFHVCSAARSWWV